MTAPKKDMPRARFCWECGRQLYQRKRHVEMEFEGHMRILHLACARALKDGKRMPDEGEDA